MRALPDGPLRTAREALRSAPFPALSACRQTPESKKPRKRAQLKKRNTRCTLRACPGAAGEKKPAQAQTNCNIVFLRGLAYWRVAKTVI